MRGGRSIGFRRAAELIPKNAKGLFMLNDSSGRDTSATVFKSYILPDGAN